MPLYFRFFPRAMWVKLGHFKQRPHQVVRWLLQLLKRLCAQLQFFQGAVVLLIMKQGQHKELLLYGSYIKLTHFLHHRFQRFETQVLQHAG